MVFLNGIRLYKIPHTDFSEELEKIEKFPYLNSYRFCEKFLNSYLSLELTPDNYLEIYASQYSFTRLFDIIFDEYSSDHHVTPHDFCEIWWGRISFLKSPLGSARNVVPAISGGSGGLARFDTGSYRE
jgi:hypothetical protein